MARPKVSGGRSLLELAGAEDLPRRGVRVADRAVRGGEAQRLRARALDRPERGLVARPVPRDALTHDVRQRDGGGPLELRTRGRDVHDIRLAEVVTGEPEPAVDGRARRRWPARMEENRSPG